MKVSYKETEERVLLGKSLRVKVKESEGVVEEKPKLANKPRE